MPKMTISPKGLKALDAVFEHTLHRFFHEIGGHHWEDARCKAFFLDCARQIGQGAQALADQGPREAPREVKAAHVRDAAQVIVAARESDCHSIIKAINAEKRVELVKEIVGSACVGNFYAAIDAHE